MRSDEFMRSEARRQHTKLPSNANGFEGTPQNGVIAESVSKRTLSRKRHQISALL
jgi:hypothetical protein